jgi:carbon-monoxide dehydrogenase large subunit
MAEIRSVGIPSPRVEGEEKVGGKALFAVDVVLPNILWVKVLRSPIPHGKIKRIDVTEAQRLPGVRAVLTGQDITGVRIGKKIADIPLLADGVVRYIGEKVAAVAAETEEAAERAVDLIDVEYQELPAVTDRWRLCNCPRRCFIPTWSLQRTAAQNRSPEQCIRSLDRNKGDVEEGFRQSDVVVENTFRCRRFIRPISSPIPASCKASPAAREVWAS